MICAEFVEASASGVVVLSPAASSPADVSSCAAVVLTGADSATLSALGFPSSTDAGIAWAWGFSLVVGSYCFAWAAGAILNMVSHKEP